MVTMIQVDTPNRNTTVITDDECSYVYFCYKDLESYKERRGVRYGCIMGRLVNPGWGSGLLLKRVRPDGSYYQCSSQIIFLTIYSCWTSFPQSMLG